MTGDLLNPPGRPCRCDSPDCRPAAAWGEPGDVARLIDRDRIRRRIATLRTRITTPR